MSAFASGSPAGDTGIEIPNDGPDRLRPFGRESLGPGFVFRFCELLPDGLDVLAQTRCFGNRCLGTAELVADASGCGKDTHAEILRPGCPRRAV